MQWHTLPVDAYGITHTALHGRLPRMLRSSGNIQLYTRINLRTYGATPTTLQHSTDTVRSHGVETLRAASSARLAHDRDDEYGPSQARGGEINTYPRVYEKGAACARSAVDIWGSAGASEATETSEGKGLTSGA